MHSRGWVDGPALATQDVGAAPTRNSHALRSCACGEMPVGAVVFAKDPMRIRCEFHCPVCVKLPDSKRHSEPAIHEQRLPVNCRTEKMAERQARRCAAMAMATWNLKQPEPELMGIDG